MGVNLSKQDWLETAAFRRQLKQSETSFSPQAVTWSRVWLIERPIDVDDMIDPYRSPQHLSVHLYLSVTMEIPAKAQVVHFGNCDTWWWRVLQRPLLRCLPWRKTGHWRNPSAVSFSWAGMRECLWSWYDWFLSIIWDEPAQEIPRWSWILHDCLFHHLGIESIHLPSTNRRVSSAPWPHCAGRWVARG